MPVLHVINLDQRYDRMQSFERVIRDKAGWQTPIWRHSAVDTRAWSTALMGGTELEPTMLSFAPYVTPRALATIKRGWRSDETELSRGAVGCALSHIRLWTLLAHHREWETMAIFEDDAIWMLPRPVEALEVVKFLNDTVPNDWDILFLGSAMLEVGKTFAVYSELKRFWCTQSYIIHRDGAAKLLEGIYPLSVQVDALMWPKIAQGGLKAYCLNKPLFFQTFEHSDVLVPHHPDRASRLWLEGCSRAK